MHFVNTFPLSHFSLSSESFACLAALTLCSHKFDLYTVFGTSISRHNSTSPTFEIPSAKWRTQVSLGWCCCCCCGCCGMTRSKSLLSFCLLAIVYGWCLPSDCLNCNLQHGKFHYSSFERGNNSADCLPAVIYLPLPKCCTCYLLPGSCFLLQLINILSACILVHVCRIIIIAILRSLKMQPKISLPLRSFPPRPLSALAEISFSSCPAKTHDSY